MSPVTTRPLSESVGVEVLGAEPDALVHDPELPERCLGWLDAHGVLVFRGLRLDDPAQVAFARRLGEPETFPGGEHPEIFVVTLDPAKSRSADYLRGTFDWHIDGMTEAIPIMATMLSARAVADSGGETEFASTYAAYEALDAAERAAIDDVRVVHSLEAANRLVWPDPTDEQLAMWRRRAPREHPLVWRHRDGRRSLVLGATTDHVVGMDAAEGRALLDDLLARSTPPERVYRHEWAVGDLVIWDNRGVLHRALPYARDSARLMHRTTIAGDEPVA
jgi:alpha-ketoglutarate-dependent taurine dioxygenase